MNTSTEFNVGDSVWCARHGTREVKETCPVCFGKLFVTVILGNDEHIKTPCDYCGKGFDGPQGYTVGWGWVADPSFQIISGKRVNENGGKREVEYTLAGGYHFSSEDVFSSKEEALARCEVKSAEHAADENKRREYIKEMAHKSFSWHVGYHRKEVRDMERRIEWHRARAVACAKLARTPVKEEASP